MTKRTLILLIALTLSSIGFAQPGDMYYPKPINLNEYPNFPRSVDANGWATNFHANPLGEITIDSSSNPGLIPFLRKEKSLTLQINLTNIPTEFYQFRYTEHLVLTITNEVTDLAFLNEFRNLKTLHLELSGTMTNSSDYLQLDSLETLTILGEKVTSLDPFKNINTITELSIHSSALKAFPEFDPFNQIQHLSIGQGGYEDCGNCPANLHKIELSNLSKLPELESLYLYHINGFTEIPTNLSKKLRALTINGGLRSNPEFGIRCKLEDLKPIISYPKLETLEITEVQLKKITGNYSKLPLERVKIEVFGLVDSSGFANFPKGETNEGMFVCDPYSDEMRQPYCKLFWTRINPQKSYYNGYEIWR